MTDTGIEITADLVRDLLQERHPDLAGLAIPEVAGGWGTREPPAWRPRASGPSPPPVSSRRPQPADRGTG